MNVWGGWGGLESPPRPVVDLEGPFQAPSVEPTFSPTSGLAEVAVPGVAGAVVLDLAGVRDVAVALLVAGGDRDGGEDGTGGGERGLAHGNLPLQALVYGPL